jgi:hypothetical protein
MITLAIPVEVVSANVLRRRFRHPHAYRKLRHSYGWALLAEAINQGAPMADGPRRVRITRIIGKGGRMFDPDNLVGGAKPLVDELVAARLIVDDTAAAAEIEYAQERGPVAGTRIEIEEAES